VNFVKTKRWVGRSLFLVLISIGLVSCETIHNHPEVSNVDSDFYAYDLGRIGIDSVLIQTIPPSPTHGMTTYIFQTKYDFRKDESLLLPAGSLFAAHQYEDTSSFMIYLVSVYNSDLWTPAQGVVNVNAQALNTGSIYLSSLVLPVPPKP
jgi:hypothetical protein